MGARTEVPFCVKSPSLRWWGPEVPSGENISLFYLPVIVGRPSKGIQCACVREGDMACGRFTPALPPCEMDRLPWCWPLCL